MMKHLLPLFLLTLSPAVLGQATIRVTANLPAAIGAANPGDILLVSGIHNLPRLVIDKPLFIHGQPGAKLNVFFDIDIQSIPAGASLALQGFEVRATEGVRVENCPGRVLLSRIRGSFVKARSCADLSITESEFVVIELADCTTTLGDSVCVGQLTNTGPVAGTPAISIGGGSLHVVDCRLQGGDNPISIPNKYRDGFPAIEMNGAEVTVNGATTVRAGRAPVNPVPAVRGTGTLVYDPSVSFVVQRGPVFAPGVTASSRAIPVTAMRSAAIGATATVEVRGRSGATFGLLVGTPGLPVTVPGFAGTFSLAQPLLLRMGTLGASGVSSLSFTVPLDPLLRGVLFRWQCGTILNGAAQWGNPVTECHY